MYSRSFSKAIQPLSHLLTEKPIKILCFDRLQQHDDELSYKLKKNNSNDRVLLGIRVSPWK